MDYSRSMERPKLPARRQARIGSGSESGSWLMPSKGTVTGWGVYKVTGAPSMCSNMPDARMIRMQPSCLMVKAVKWTV